MEYKVLTNNCFLRLDGNIHGPIKVIRSSKFRDTPSDAMVYVNESLTYDLEATQGSGFKISKNLPVYLANNIPIDINTIRKSYTVKRKEEDAHYVVIAPFKNSERIWLRDLHYFPESDIIIEYTYLTAETLIAIKREFNLNGNGIKLNIDWLFGFRDPKHSIEKLIKGQFTKPVISPSQLDLNTGDPLTVDVLNLTKRIGSVDFNSSDAEKNLILNIEALNNYNWRQYKGTVGIVLRSMSYDKDAVYRMIIPRIKSQNKTVQDVLSARKCYDFIGKEDFELAQDYIASLLNIDHYPMFVSTRQILTKLTDNGIAVQEFEKLFGAVAKLQKKEYVEQKSED